MLAALEEDRPAGERLALERDRPLDRDFLVEDETEGGEPPHTQTRRQADRRHQGGPISIPSRMSAPDIKSENAPSGCTELAGNARRSWQLRVQTPNRRLRPSRD